MSEESLDNTLSLTTEIDTPLNLSEKIKGLLVIVSPPGHGKIVTIDDDFYYAPDKGFVGTDAFRIKENQNHIIVVNVTNNVFKPRARLLLQLGDQLIRNESIALVELVKNSYDADASYSNVVLSQVDKPNIASILIEDDGWGMDVNTIKNSWLEPGSDNKEKQVQAKIVTPKFGRLPIGEKGIGRFGVHKLGKVIELVSKKEGSPEVYVKINWEEFKDYKYLNEAPITITEREPVIFKNGNTGTRIVITHLHKPWTRGLVRDIYRAINALSSPTTFNISSEGEMIESEEGSFNPSFIIDYKEWIKDIPDWDEIKQYALFHFDITIEGALIKSFKYRFQPWENMSKVSGRFIKEIDKPVSQMLELVTPDPDTKGKKVISIDTGEANIGVIEFKGSIFVRDKAILKIVLNQPSPVSNYLDANGGIRIYRDGMRIYDYGEPGNDWLELDYRRFNDPSLKISNNMIIASVNLDRNASSDLIEKTNREGFIENQAYYLFRKAITHALRIVEILRRHDKNKIDSVYKTPKRLEPVLSTIGELKDIVNRRVPDSILKKDITDLVDRIETNYKFMNDTLIKTATVGVGWSIYIHEIEKIISEIEKVITQPDSANRLPNLVSHLSKIIENYAQILRKTSRKDENLTKVIDQSLFNIEYRLRVHNVTIIPAFKEHNIDTKIKISRNLIVGTIMNIIDNSIYWLERVGRDNKKIFIDLVKSDKYLSIIIADNGPGFPLPPEELTEPFATTKPEGIGLGLHITREIMQAHSGELLFNENGDFLVPEEFRNGATVILNFIIK